MAKYFYSKYNSVSNTYYSEGSFVPGAIHEFGWPEAQMAGYPSYSFNSSTGLYTATGGQTATMRGNSPAGTSMYTGATNSTVISRIVKGSGLTYQYYTSTRQGPFVSYSRGTLVQSNIQAENGTYPVNGRHTDGYWYVRGPLVNATPTLILNTENNLTLSEAAGQDEVLVDGSALDTDSNNTVTIKAQFNNGTVRNLNSAISDGATPIPFSKRFTYSDKKMFDGATPLTVDLAENTDHTLKVWAEDSEGGISTVSERKFRVIHNRPPTITDTDRDLGTLIESPSITYQVNDLEGQAITVTEKVNGQVIRTFEADPNTDYTLEIPIEKWIPLQLQQHSLTIEAVDTIGAKTIRTYTFTRTEDTILLELKNPFVTDIAASRILVTPDVYVPIGSTIKIEACNNAFDETPTWEDITGMAMNKRGYTFTNTEKTAEEWGINIRFTLEKGTATQQVRLEGFGGAFD